MITVSNNKYRKSWGLIHTIFE